jgi:hypothetical protein
MAVTAKSFQRNIVRPGAVRRACWAVVLGSLSHREPGYPADHPDRADRAALPYLREIIPVLLVPMAS